MGDPLPLLRVIPKKSFLYEIDCQLDYGTILLKA
jgi:hypothetical protein